jgi:hypothetical protein
MYIIIIIIFIIIYSIYILWRVEPLLSDDSVNSGLCWVAPAIYMQETKEQRDYTTRF